MKPRRKSTQPALPRTPGGPREGSGRKTDEFKAQCQALAGSPEFFKWAARVFKGEGVVPKMTIDGRTVMIEASPSDKIYLWEKLAAYGYGKPSEIDPPKSPASSVANVEAAMAVLKMMEEVSRNANSPASSGSHSNGLANGAALIQAQGPATPRL